MHHNRLKRYTLFALLVLMVTLLSGCALLDFFTEDVSQSFSGVQATYRSYAQDGTLIDEVVGESFQITRDKRFDSSDSEGYSNEDSQVLQISIGSNFISHVGSTMILEESGLEDAQGDVDTQVFIENLDAGVPFVNKLRENNQNLWRGKGKTILIRSQDGLPVATYVGDEVEIFSTSIPKSTWFQVDGKMLFVYRADYTIIDNELFE